MKCHQQAQDRSRKQHLLVAAALALLIGAGYYLFFRIYNHHGLTDPTGGSLPSLVHMLALTWFAFALTGIMRGLAIATAVLLISIIGEWQIGYASWLDTAMLVSGYGIASISAARHLNGIPARRFTTNTSIAGVCLLLCSVAFITGTSCVNGTCGDTPSDQFRRATPVYMDYQTLRSSIAVTEPRPLSDIGRVYVYGDSILLNSRNQGLHLLDNSDPGNPSNIAFIEIPGNTEVSIRDNALYVDSYIDLVTLDISDPQNIVEVDRELGIFEYDEYQNVPDDIYFVSIDESRGVVISYVSRN